MFHPSRGWIVYTLSKYRVNSQCDCHEQCTGTVNIKPSLLFAACSTNCSSHVLNFQTSCFGILVHDKAMSMFSFILSADPRVSSADLFPRTRTFFGFHSGWRMRSQRATKRQKKRERERERERNIPSIVSFALKHPPYSSHHINSVCVPLARGNSAGFSNLKQCSESRLKYRWL